MVKDDKHEVAVLRFIDSKGVEPLEVKAGFSFVSIENAQMNLKAEMLNKSFAQVQKKLMRLGKHSSPRFKLQVARNVKRDCFILLSSMLLNGRLCVAM